MNAHGVDGLRLSRAQLQAIDELVVALPYGQGSIIVCWTRIEGVVLRILSAQRQAVFVREAKGPEDTAGRESRVVPFCY